MAQRQSQPLRALTPEERAELERVARSQRERAERVARAKQLLAVADGEIYLHHGAVLPDVLRMLFGPAVNAVSARGSAAKPGAQAIDPVDRLERLAKLRDAGILTQEEFDAAKAQIMRELI